VAAALLFTVDSWLLSRSIIQTCNRMAGQVFEIGEPVALSFGPRELLDD
jgi:hypothetical protein